MATTHLLHKGKKCPQKEEGVIDTKERKIYIASKWNGNAKEMGGVSDVIEYFMVLAFAIILVAALYERYE